MGPIRIRVLLICLVAMFCCTGCMEAAAIAPAATLAGAATMAGLEQDLSKSKERIIAEKIALQEQLSAATSQATIDDLKAQIKSLDKKQSTVEVAQAGVGIAKQGLSTDWTDPEQAAPWFTSLIMAGFAYFQRKEKKSLADDLNEYKARVTDYMAESAPIEAMALKNKLKGA